jgi:hypothetical protein
LPAKEKRLHHNKSTTAIETTMRITPLLLLSLMPTASAGKHKRAKTHKRKKKLDHKLIQSKSLEPWKWHSAWGDSVTRAFGPKQKGQLCNTLTSSVVLFDLDGSGGLDWAEFQSFNIAIVDVAKDHMTDGECSIRC